MPSTGRHPGDPGRRLTARKSAWPTRHAPRQITRRMRSTQRSDSCRVSIQREHVGPTRPDRSAVAITNGAGPLSRVRSSRCRSKPRRHGWHRRFGRRQAPQSSWVTEISSGADTLRARRRYRRCWRIRRRCERSRTRARCSGEFVRQRRPHLPASTTPTDAVWPGRSPKATPAATGTAALSTAASGETTEIGPAPSAAKNAHMPNAWLTPYRQPHTTAPD
jgi:hypothetical protein